MFTARRSGRLGAMWAMLGRRSVVWISLGVVLAAGAGASVLFGRERRGVEGDASVASFFAGGCDGVNAPGCKSLGLLVDQGPEVIKDEAPAASPSAKARGGDTGRYVNLGFLVEEERGGDQDEARAADLFAKACDGGDARGCFKLGV